MEAARLAESFNGLGSRPNGTKSGWGSRPTGDHQGIFLESIQVGIPKRIATCCTSSTALSRAVLRECSRAVSRAVFRGGSEPFKVGIPKQISSAELSREISRVVPRAVSREFFFYGKTRPDRVVRSGVWGQKG